VQFRRAVQAYADAEILCRDEPCPFLIQQPSHKQAMRGYDLLRRSGIQPDIVCVVHSLNVQYPLTVHRFFRDIGCRCLGFLPVVEQAPGTAAGVTPHTPSAAEYGEFLCKIFDEWLRRDVGRIAVQIIEEAAQAAMGLEHSLCVFRPMCGQIPVIEHNGDYFPCDHYVDRGHRLGNILETPIGDLLDSEAQRAFGDSKRDALPRCCRDCEVLAMCNGGCPEYRRRPVMPVKSSQEAGERARVRALSESCDATTPRAGGGHENGHRRAGELKRAEMAAGEGTRGVMTGAASIHQISPEGWRNGFRFGVDPQLSVDVPHVETDRVDADSQLVCRVLGAAAFH
jgi:radical SAM protein with 4Fe4S-binding SPASM domain